MIQSFQAMAEEIKLHGAQKIAVAAAQDDDVLLSVDHAAKVGIASPILVGDQEKILAVAQKCGVDVSAYEIVDEKDSVAACSTAVRLVREGRAGAVMKGLVGTADVLKAVLNKETGIRDAKVLSHLGMFYIESLDRFIYITDAAICIAPDIEIKQHILQNAVNALHLLGYEDPKVGCICALEKVNPAMQATLDAEELVRRNREGIITGCTVGGPFALDNALSLEAARHKGVNWPAAGQAELLLMPQIESANVLYKALTIIGGLCGAGLVLGAKRPVILTSRSDDDTTKFNSICLALYLAYKADAQ